MRHLAWTGVLEGHGEPEGCLSEVDRVGFGFGGPDVGEVHLRI